MKEQPKVLAIIPARGGSKGVKGKNIAPLNGVPLIGYTIQAAQGSRLLTRTIVSTDSELIAGIARSLGGDVPFLRPEEFATDTSPTAPVVLHAIDFLEQQGETYDYVALLQPTSPLRTTEDIDTAIQLLTDHSEAQSVVSVAKLDDPHPMKVQKISVEGYLLPFIDGAPRQVRRQDLPPVYRWNGVIYVARIPTLRAQEGKLVLDPCLPYVMPEERSVNIDTPMSLQFADFLLSSRS